jgi:hypothetical protein
MSNKTKNEKEQAIANLETQKAMAKDNHIKNLIQKVIDRLKSK